MKSVLSRSADSRLQVVVAIVVVHFLVYEALVASMIMLAPVLVDRKADEGEERYQDADEANQEGPNESWTDVRKLKVSLLKKIRSRAKVVRRCL